VSLRANENLAACSMPPPSEEKPRGSRLVALGRALLPWVSLVFAIVSAVSMDRRPERAWLIAVAAGVGWIVLAVAAVLDGIRVERLPALGAWAARAAQASMVMGAQSLIQLCLFFSAPFYFGATAVPEHVAFLVLLLVAAGATLWNPLCLALLRHAP